MERFLDLLNSVKRNSNSTFYSCEPELIELMRQIDEMIEEKKKEWDKEMSILEREFQDLKDDNTSLHVEINHLNQAISNTKKKLDEEKRSHSNTLARYDEDVKVLKDDLKSIKKKYMGLQKKIEVSRKREQDRTEKAKTSPQITCLCQGRMKSTAIKDNQSVSDITVLQLQLEAVQLENTSLRSILQQNSQPLFPQYTEFDSYTLVGNNFVTLQDPVLERTDPVQSAFSIKTHRQHNEYDSPSFHNDQSSCKSFENSPSTYNGDVGCDDWVEDRINNVIVEFETYHS